MKHERNSDPAFIAGISQTVIYPIALVRIDWPGEELNLHTGAGSLPFEGASFMGTLVNGENLGVISVPSEVSGLRPLELTLTLYGLYSDLLNRLNPQATGREVKVWAGVTTEPGGNVLIGVPELVFVGAISGDMLAPPTSGAVAAMMLRVKSGTHGRVRGSITHSDEDQQSVYLGDTFFERTARATAYRSAPPKW